ncbi:hypothetical protein [Magnetospirillum sulfuroxidans]|uniref:Uncharacterized protein n=1 Tax=Magnetospirillum sulfuroxidans TaxID=611300 RepID=A0ABS5IDE1_9PROT|nr:hypothetical protein [Magnetospirillum sulfuroxidans]MBR9972449.1 hypothetical protein [Magnetospirillum sulfuroxidans]
MIKDRPKGLLARPEYSHIPPLPLAVSLETVPELVRASLGPLGGIQPVTKAMSDAAAGPLFDLPSPGEVELFRRAGTKFQMVQVVLSLAGFTVEGEASHAIPYSLSLIPASKRGKVEALPIDYVEKIDLEAILGKSLPFYGGYDPFLGTWGFYASTKTFGGALPSRFIDELGLVVAAYFLATEYDCEDILNPSIGFTDPDMEKRYNKNHRKTFFKPFKKLEARRVWGSQSPIELFLFQSLILRGLRPTPQVWFCDGGAVYASLHHMWRDVEFRHVSGAITEADLYFPDQRVAIFCDSIRHHRGSKKLNKDTSINERLRAIDVEPIRVPGNLIVHDIDAATDMVCQALKRKGA